jgi:hypothetical protein
MIDGRPCTATSALSQHERRATTGDDLHARGARLHPAGTRHVLLDPSDRGGRVELKVWRGGPQAGQPKLPPAAKSLLERGLMRLDATSRMPGLFFTDLGLAALRVMMADRRLANPEKFAHVRQELGIDS